MREGTRVELRGLSANYGSVRAVENVSIRLAAGRLLALLGPSGCGKTTLLRLLAGLLEPSNGEIVFDGVSVAGIPAERRGVAMVFQKPLLFPHMNVAGNVAFGLKMRGISPAETSQRVREALDSVQMSGFDHRGARELSGGQEQRVALARALVTQPRVLLLDEPFSALDERLRAGMRSLVRDLQRRMSITTLFVTHDQSEAAQVADEIALMLHGSIEQTGPVRDFYERPASETVARFFGWQQWDADRFCRPECLRIGIPDALLIDGELSQTGILMDVVDAGTHLIFRVNPASGNRLEAHCAPEAADRHWRPGDHVAVRVPARLTVQFVKHRQ